MRFPDIFIDPQTGLPLELSSDCALRSTINKEICYPFQRGLIDFTSPLHTINSETLYASPYSNSDSAPELKKFHDEQFKEAAESKTSFYEFIRLPPITRSGHFRRMELLDRIDLGDLTGKVAVDFGTGPWGFACIFPKLRQASYCVGFDVSVVALAQARNATAQELRDRVIYATSDGDIIPLQDSTVDVFFGGEVIEHVRKPEVFIQNIARVCKDNAIVILTTPNRDALTYLIHNQPYCVGPEHISLLNYMEFEEKLNLFLDIHCIIGYETSLAPQADMTIDDESILNLAQLRSEKFPQLSSGMIAVGSVNKKKYLKNKRFLLRREFLWDNPIFEVTESSQVLNLFGSVTGLSLSHGAMLSFTSFSEDLTILFWGHPWSGIVEIRYNNEVMREIDLYLPEGGFLRADLALPRSGIIHIRPTGRKRAEAKGTDVIFYKSFGYIPTNKEQSCGGIRYSLISN